MAYLISQRHLNSNQRIVTLVGHGLEVAGNTAVGIGILAVSETAGDFLFDLGHAQVSFGTVVGESHVAIFSECLRNGMRALTFLMPDPTVTMRSACSKRFPMPGDTIPDVITSKIEYPMKKQKKRRPRRFYKVCPDCWHSAGR